MIWITFYKNDCIKDVERRQNEKILTIICLGLLIGAAIPVSHQLMIKQLVG